MNQTLPLGGGGYVIVNEQIASVQGNKGSITVNALHIVIPEQKVDGLVTVPGTDLVVAQAHADILCGGNPAGCPGDRVTGGGWYYWPSSPNRVHFALAAKNGLTSWGHLLYMDKAREITAKGTPASSALTYTPGSKNDGFGTVEGPASSDSPINGESVGYFVVRFADNGEPGKGDAFGIQLLTQKNGAVLYDANVSLAVTLDGGNLQFHHCKYRPRAAEPPREPPTTGGSRFCIGLRYPLGCAPVGRGARVHGRVRPAAEPVTAGGPRPGSQITRRV